MDIGEKLFHWSWQISKKIKAPKKNPHVFYFETKKEHLTMLASAFYGETVSLKKAETCGGIIGDSIFLPNYCDLFESLEWNYQFFLYRIMFDITAKEMGLTFKPELLSFDDLKIISLCSHFSVIRHMIKQYPNLSPITDNVFKRYINKFNGNDDDIYLNAIKYYLNESSPILSELKPLIDIIARNHTGASSLIDAGKEFKSILTQTKIPVALKPPMIFHILPTLAQVIKISKNEESQIGASNQNNEKTVMDSKSKERIKKVELDEKDPNCNPTYLLKDSVKTADIFSGGKKMVDGSDELDDHISALEELEIREMSRSSTQTQSVFKADISVEVDYADDEDDSNAIVKDVYLYPEWNCQNKSYRKDWCRVQETTLKIADDQSHFLKYKSEVLEKYQKEIKELRSGIENILLSKRPKNRQIDGPDIDLDAVICANCDLKSGHSPSNKLYVSKRKHPNNVSFCLLIDSSLSADSYVQGKKVIEITKETILVLEQVTEKILDEIMIASFYSNTRKSCSYNIIKTINEDWPVVQSRLLEVVPSGYTRIGSALRHSIFHMSNMKSKRKVILLLSDGKPTDYDVYEGKYGINDVRQCVREAKQQGIDILSLAIDREAKFYFPRLFGTKNYKIITTPEQLPSALIEMLQKLI